MNMLKKQKESTPGFVVVLSLLTTLCIGFITTLLFTYTYNDFNVLMGFNLPSISFGQMYVGFLVISTLNLAIGNSVQTAYLARQSISPLEILFASCSKLLAAGLLFVFYIIAKTIVF